MTAETIDSVDVRVYTFPTDAPEADGTLSWDSTTMVLAEVGAAGRRGLGWTYGPRACASVITDVLASVVRGRSPGTNPARDLERMRETRVIIGDDVELFVDANGGYGAKQAIRLVNTASDLDVRWFEEPVSSDDLEGLREVRGAVLPDVAAGEYGCDLYYFRRMCAAGAALDPTGGVIRPDPGAPGLGLTLRTADAEAYRTQ